MTRVIVIDPGERTGWVRCDLDDKGGIVRGTLAQGVHTIRDFAEALHKGAVLENKYDAIVFETWRLRADKAHSMIGNEFLPIQLIGMIRMCGWLSGAKLVSYGPQTKGTGRQKMPEILRRRLRRSNEEHDKDALDLLSYHIWKVYKTT